MINLLNFIEQVFFYFLINGKEFLGSISTYIHEMLAQSLFVTYCAVPNMDFQHYKNIIYLLNKKGISSSDLKDIYISVGLFDVKSQELFIEFMFLNPRSAYDEYFKALVAYCEYRQGSRSEYLLYTKQQLHAI
jgi:hypothetical protein